MREVTLFGTDITTTALGFGTSTLMGRLSSSESLRLLEIAYDNGIRHFDTAPLYGYGESEGLLGSFISKRSDVTIASKFGLLRPRANSFLFRRAKEIGRPLLRVFPGLRKQVRKAVHEGVADVRNFDATAAEVSLRTSLKRLKRDRIDLYFLHECRQSDLQDDRLLSFLSKAKDRGDIRSFGIATDVGTINFAIESAQLYASIVQLPNNPSEPNLELFPALAMQRACVTHSPFGGFGGITSKQIDSALSYAALQNPHGVVLFSSQNGQHIVNNITSFLACAPRVI